MKWRNFIGGIEEGLYDLGILPLAMRYQTLREPVEEIVERMNAVDEHTLNLPYEFAHTLRSLKVRGERSRNLREQDIYHFYS
jgi:hypothetical protein